MLGRQDDPRIPGTDQYHFLQALVRTIALGTLSRRERKARHLAAAEHLRATWGDSTEIAEVLASHYLDAVEADPDAADADAIRASARETLTAAGHRAVSLALGVEARRYFEQAAALAQSEVDRAGLLAEAGVAAARAADRDAARSLLGNAITVFDGAGQDEDAARTRALLADVLIGENRLVEAGELIDRARLSLTDEVVIAELAARRAQVAFLSGDLPRARDESDLALSIADPRSLKSVMADAVITKANTFQYANRIAESQALQSLGLRIALEADITDQALRAYFNLSEFDLLTGRPQESAVLLDAESPSPANAGTAPGSEICSRSVSACTRSAASGTRPSRSATRSRSRARTTALAWRRPTSRGSSPREATSRGSTRGSRGREAPPSGRS